MFDLMARGECWPHCDNSPVALWTQREYCVHPYLLVSKAFARAVTYALETYVVTSGPESLAQYARGLSQGSRAVRARYFSAVWGAFPPDVGAAEADMLAVVLPQLVNLQLLDTGTWPAASPGQLVEAVVGLPALRAVKWSGWGGEGPGADFSALLEAIAPSAASLRSLICGDIALGAQPHFAPRELSFDNLVELLISTWIDDDDTDRVMDALVGIARSAKQLRYLQLNNSGWAPGSLERIIEPVIASLRALQVGAYFQSDLDAGWVAVRTVVARCQKLRVLGLPRITWLDSDNPVLASLSALSFVGFEVFDGSETLRLATIIARGRLSYLSIDVDAEVSEPYTLLQVRASAGPPSLTRAGLVRDGPY